jgi:hypothetical protein
MQMLLLYNFVRIIHVQAEISHDGQVIPQDMLEIIDVPQVGKQISHYTDNRVRTTIAFFAVFYRQAVVYHVLNVAAIFRKSHGFRVCVILHLLFFHQYFTVQK